MKTKTIIAAVVTVVLALAVTGYMPLTEKFNIRRATTSIVKNECLSAGESMTRVNGTQHKEPRTWNGQDCMYVVSKYTVRTTDGNKETRVLHMLMSKNMRQVVASSHDGKAEWVRDQQQDIELMKQELLQEFHDAL